MRHAVLKFRRSLYRAYFSAAPMGNIMERYWYMTKREIYFQGWRDGYQCASSSTMRETSSDR